MADEDDEGGFGGLYEDGHWVWDDSTESLVFISDLPPKVVESIQIPIKAPTGAIEFRDDVDLIEQIRFRRRYQRKLNPGQADIITLQDVKDIAIYTAPVNILSPMLINMLHLPTTERFIRGFILYCQYYLQISDEMSNRIMELETKVRTPVCEILENEYRDNLADLRVLVAKEYCTMLIGGNDTRKFHHMGPQKKRRSLSDKDARLFETLLRMCVQIVWLALGRKSFNQIDVNRGFVCSAIYETVRPFLWDFNQQIADIIQKLEANRLFKSEIFNAVEHTLKTGYAAKMTKVETAVLFGNCLRHDKKLNTRSPLMNEVFCHRDVDYRMMGLGVVKSSQMTPRLHYMLLAIAGPEEILAEVGVVLGIIGSPRSVFDTMLRPLPAPSEGGKSKGSISSQSGYSAKSTGSVKKSTQAMQKLYPDIVLPRRESKKIAMPSSFPGEPEEILPCSDTQRRRWLNRLNKLLHPVR